MKEKKLDSLIEKEMQKSLFKQTVKFLATHGQHEKKFEYGTSYPIGDNKTLTLVHRPAHMIGDTEVPEENMAFVVEKIKTEGYEISRRESYFANGFISIHYGMSIADFTDPEGRETRIVGHSGEPDSILLTDYPGVVKQALFQKIIAEKEIPRERKIGNLLKLLTEIDHEEKESLQRHHVSWHFIKKHSHR